MRRLLSQILIIILLLLGPITFTTVNVPNFQPDCEIGRSFRITTTVKVAIADAPLSSTLPISSGKSPQDVIHIPSSPLLSQIFPHACYSRPPPRS